MDCFNECLSLELILLIAPEAFSCTKSFIPIISSLLNPFPNSQEYSQDQAALRALWGDLRRMGFTYDSMPKGKSWLIATVALKFFLLSLHTSSRPRWGGLEVRRHKQIKMYYTLSSYSDFLVAALNKLANCRRCLLSRLCSYILFPRNGIRSWSCEGLPSHRLERDIINKLKSCYVELLGN